MRFFHTNISRLKDETPWKVKHENFITGKKIVSLRGMNKKHESHMHTAL
jgi:hypothetical protein